MYAFRNGLCGPGRLTHTPHVCMCTHVVCYIVIKGIENENMISKHFISNSKIYVCIQSFFISHQTCIESFI